MLEKKKILFCFFSFLFLGWSSDVIAESLTNGGFETGDFTGWTLTNGVEEVNKVDRGQPHSGRYGASFGNPSADGLASLSQSVPTMPGHLYALTFWITAESGSGFSGASNEFKASFDGTTLLNLAHTSAFPYTRYTYIVTATSTSGLIQFDASNDTSFFSLDDVNFIPIIIHNIPHAKNPHHSLP